MQKGVTEIVGWVRSALIERKLEERGYNFLSASIKDGGNV